MSFSRKMVLGAVVVALVGTGLGAIVGASIAERTGCEEVSTVQITERRVHGPSEGEVAMVSTLPTRASATTSTTRTEPGATPVATTSEARRESERLASPSLVREARTHRVDGTRGGEGLRVRRLLVATGIDDREPTGVSETFDGEDARLYAFVDLANHGDETGVEVSFEPEVVSRDAHVSGLVTLEVPGEVGRHRTWAWSRGVHAPGRWSVVVRELEGHELARTPFTIE
jgi:hypothetical protein